MLYNNKDYVPRRDSDFDGWLANIAAYVESKMASGWSHIPQDKLTELKRLNAEWHNAYVKTRSPHSSKETDSKNTARDSAEAFIRPFVAQYLKFEPVNNEDRIAMNLHNPSDTRTPIGKPSTRAMITELKALGGFQIEIRFHDETTPDSSAKPYGYNGALLNYTWQGDKTSDYGELVSSALMTHSPFTLTLPPASESKHLSCTVRWQNNKGELGPWGDIHHIVIV